MSKRIRREKSYHELDRELDRDLEATFPASDPLKITRISPVRPTPPHSKHRTDAVPDDGQKESPPGLPRS